MSKLKTPLVVAGVSCIVSMLIGLISGVRFLNILIRGTAAGLGVGLFVFAARLLLEKCIPDLFVRQSLSDAADTAESGAGVNVNITLDDSPDTLSAEQEAGSAGKVSGTHSMTADQDDAGGESPAAGFPQNASGSPVLSFTENSENDTGLADFPDMGDFMESEPVSSDDTDNVISSDGSGFSISGIQPADTDSKVMAQAIRTILVTED